MDILILLKAGFIGFAMCLGMQMLVFYLIGRYMPVSERNFMRIFILAGVISFLALDFFLYYRITVNQVPNADIFLAGCIGGWLGGIVSGLTHMKRFFLSIAR
jgi:hypothetical protein